MALEGGAYWLLVEFADDGVGLTPEVRERLFEPFFTTKRGQGGSGLGMHIVYTIVHQMGGQVAVAQLPRHRLPPQAAAGPGAPTLSQFGGQRQRHRFGHLDAVDAGRQDAARVAGAFAGREQARVFRLCSVSSRRLMRIGDEVRVSSPVSTASCLK
jgi:hypothetical protein